MYIIQRMNISLNDNVYYTAKCMIMPGQDLRKVQRYAMILPYRGRVILTGAKRYYEYRSDNIAKRYYTMPNDKTLG